jgi:uncharacterized delta-60 repeat protein
MNLAFAAVRLVLAGLIVTLAACGGGDGDPGSGAAATPVPPAASAVIGAAGGTVNGPNGARVVIPPGALATDTAITIEQTSAGSPALPNGLAASGAMFSLTPHGTVFAVAATVTLPFDTAALPAGTLPAFYKTNARNEWELQAAAVFDATSVTVPVSGFSHTQVVIPPVQRLEPTREWEFRVISGNGLNETDLPPPEGQGIQTGGALSRGTTFGPVAFDLVTVKDGIEQPVDGLAEGRIFSSPDGVTFGVLTEAPFVEPGGSQPIGSVAFLRQTQTFIKRANNASLSYTITSVIMRTVDFKPTSDLDTQLGLDMNAFAFQSVGAFHGQEAPPGVNPSSWSPGGNFYYASANATLRGSNGRWFPTAEDYAMSRRHVWSIDNFDLSQGPAFMARDGTIVSDPQSGGCQGTTAMLVLKEPRTFHIDLSSVPLHGKFALYINAGVNATNRRGGGSIGDCEGSSVSSYLRDPLEIGGTTVTFEGLEPTNEIPPPEPATAVLVEPAVCTSSPAPDPAAGTIQFSASGYRIGETLHAPQTIRVTRSGGSKGAVTATFRTSDGSAVGGTDYTPVHASVFFGDGDDAPRLIEVPIIGNAVDAPDKTVTLTLSQPGGCAALGAITTAVLTILDDDDPPPATNPGALDTGFGNQGRATTTAFGGDRSAMARQPDGKFVIVGGTFIDFVLARFNANGTLDTTFGAGGKVTTDMVAGEQEEALAVAVQPDGRIVVAGYTGTPGPGGPTNFALIRYLADGTPDASFGTGGKVTSGVAGRILALALQPDGRIVAAGDSLPTGDVKVARYRTDGSLDPGFAAGGVVVTDLGGEGDIAENVVLQPDGAIVVSGVNSGTVQTGLVRYLSNGTPDPSFGNAGKVVLPGATVGGGLALQADGKLVLVGNARLVANGTEQFALRRLNANGTADLTFGTAGAVFTDISGRGDTAYAVALQADGKILAAGRSSRHVNSNFAVARYTADGVLDLSFANAGRVAVDFFGFTDIAETVIVQPDGKIVLGGLAQSMVDGYGVARIDP